MAIGRYDYEGLIKTFLNQSEPNGSTAEGRMSFAGNTLKSYRSVLAKLKTYPKSTQKVLFIDRSIAGYSVTTTKHTNLLLRINNYPIQYWRFNNTPEQNVLYIIEYLDKLLIKHKKARSNKSYIANEIIQTYENLSAVIKEYSIDKRTKVYKQFNRYIFILFLNKILKKD